MRNSVSQARRERVERGIYRRQAASGVAYEITFTDSDGRQRWQRVEGGLREARAARAEVVAKLGRGERVAPSRQTFGEVATAWLATQNGQLRPRTHDLYATVLRVHLQPRFGRRRMAEIDTDAAASLLRDLRAQGLSPYTCRNVLTVLGRVFSHAVRRGLVPVNPVAGLERGERPRLVRREMRVLTTDEIGRLLQAVDEPYRVLVAVSVFAGLRQGEALGLVWSDVDFGENVIRVRQALGRDGKRGPTKTPEAVRDVAIAPSLAAMLRRHKLASPYSQPSDFVFASVTGTPLHYRNVTRRGLEAAVKRAGLDEEGKPKLRWHDLRHGFASMLIAQGRDVAWVSKQLGHTRSSVTLDIYSHLFNPTEQAERSREAMEASFGSILEAR